jgi:hypothetical protein
MKRVLTVVRHCLLNDEFSSFTLCVSIYNCLYSNDKWSVILFHVLYLQNSRV